MKNNGMEGKKAEPIWSRQAMLPVRYIAKFALKPLCLEISRGGIGKASRGNKQENAQGNTYLRQR
jgi:hypothetical protein